MFRRSRRIQDLNLVEPTAEEKNRARGHRNEERAIAALALLQEQREIDSFHKSWERAELDSQGIDFLVWPESGENLILAFQVKSSDFGRISHLVVSRGKIPCIVIDDGDNTETIARKILESLGLSVSSLLEEFEKGA